MNSAVLLYVIGFAATATSPIDDRRMLEKPIWFTLVIALAWPVLAVLLVGTRIWRASRG